MRTNAYAPRPYATYNFYIFGFLPSSSTRLDPMFVREELTPCLTSQSFTFTVFLLQIHYLSARYLTKTCTSLTNTRPKKYKARRERLDQLSSRNEQEQHPIPTLGGTDHDATLPTINISSPRLISPPRMMGRREWGATAGGSFLAFWPVHPSVARYHNRNLCAPIYSQNFKCGTIRGTTAPSHHE